MESVVSTKRLSVRKTCEPDPCSPTNVTVTIEVDAKGKVTRANVTSTRGDPKVGACIARMARTWTFPKSEEGGTFAIPYVFVC